MFGYCALVEIAVAKLIHHYDIVLALDLTSIFQFIYHHCLCLCLLVSLFEGLLRNLHLLILN